jgi:O-antigen/teichoic acid export membrane protein
MVKDKVDGLISVDMLKTLWQKGFYHIFGSAFINKIIQFCASIFLVRILSKELYGIWTYAENILQMFLLLQGIGCVVGLLQYSSAAKDKYEKYKYLKFSLFVGIFSNLLVGIAILFFSLFGKLCIEGSKQVLLLLCIFPLINVLFDIIQMYFRSSFENRKFSALTMVNSVTFLVFSTVGAYIWGIKGIVMGRYTAVALSVIVGFYYLRDVLPSIFKAENLSNKEKKEFMGYSFVSMISNIFSSLLFLLDVFLIGFLLKDSLLVASYKIATIIPFAMNFLPMTIIVYVSLFGSGC